MAEITHHEKKCLKQFRERLDDLNLDEEKTSDSFLLRWLRAREMNLKKAEDMLRSNLKWRENNKIDLISEWRDIPEKLEAMTPLELCGHDNNGYPIFVFPMRYFDYKAAKDFNQDQYVHLAIQILENISKAMKDSSTKENPITRAVFLCDIDQTQITQFLSGFYFSLLQQMVVILEENYPEILQKIYVLCAPNIFAMLFSALKTFIPKKTVEKFQVYGSNKETWRSELFSHVQLDQIPPRYGGTNEFFEETAFAKSKLFSGEDDTLTEASIGAGKKLKLDFQIPEANSTLKWSFKIENHDIGFSVHLDGDEILSDGRVASKKKLQEGYLVCEKDGEYTIIFDNTHSRLRSKRIHYRVEIDSPSL